MRRVLVTGSAGVIGRAVAPALAALGFEVASFDRATSTADDLGDAARVRAAVAGCRGVVHLAACSRVEAAERRPDDADRDNVRATAALIAAIAARPDPPWIVFASSREVHGDARSLPVDEDTPIAPRNVYGRTKRDAEAMVEAARARGLAACVLRLTNVFGAPCDHHDRLVPAFFAAARAGAPLVVRGAARSVDLVHLDDAVDGLARAAARLDAGARGIAPVLIASGVETTLGALAALVIAAARSTSAIVEDAAGSHEVARFVGRPARAAEVLGWRPRVGLGEGLSRLARTPAR